MKYHIKHIFIGIVAGFGLIGLALFIMIATSGKPTATGAPSQASDSKRDRIPINTVCYLGPAHVFDTNDDVTLYEIDMIKGDSFAANNMLSNQFGFWLREKASAKVLYHGPYQGFVAPDAPKSTRDALNQFEICQVQILDGVYKNKIGWVVDTDLRCPTQKGK